MLSAVLFDVGGTPWPDVLTAPLSPEPVLEQLGRLMPDVDPADALEHLRQALKDDDAALVQDTHAVVARALRSLCGTPLQTDTVAIRRALCQPASRGVQFFPGAVQLLADIRRLGLRYVVVSNVQVRGAVEYWRDFADLGVAECINDIVTSLDARKPHPAIFEAATRAAACDAESSVMVGDSEIKDIQPAVATGMRAIRVAIEAPLPETTAAHAVADGLPTVSDILQRWAMAHNA